MVSRHRSRQPAGALFDDDSDGRGFLGIIAESPERFELEVYAFTLMDDHYHLLLHTPEPKLSDAMP